MRTIRWKLEVGYPGGDIADEVEVEDTATDEEIEALVLEEIWNRVSFSWREAGK